MTEQEAKALTLYEFADHFSTYVQDLRMQSYHQLQRDLTPREIEISCNTAIVQAEYLRYLFRHLFHDLWRTLAHNRREFITYLIIAFLVMETLALIFHG